jgi:hypothetical protein
MYEEREPLFDKLQTSRAIKALVEKYADDLRGVYVEEGGKKIPVSRLSIVDYFDVVRLIPYRKDTKPIEIISRPHHILKYRGLGMDCKKKSILMASFFKLRNIPFRFIGSSRRPDKKIHHIFTQAKVNPDGTRSNKFVNYDSTYKHYRPAMEKKVTAFEVL